MNLLGHVFKFKSTSNSEEHVSPMKGRSTSTPHKIVKPYSSLFGIPLETAVDLCPHENKQIPLPIANALDFINKRCLDEVGLYRIPGNKRIVEQYRDDIDNGKIINFISDYDTKTHVHEAHDVCALIRMFFLSLPDSIFTSEFSFHFQMTQFEPNPDQEVEQKVKFLSDMVNQLPRCNRDTLEYFVRHLTLIVGNSSVNQMTAMNVVISMFGMSAHTRAYYLLITHFSEIFKVSSAPSIRGRRAAVVHIVSPVDLEKTRSEEETEQLIHSRRNNADRLRKNRLNSAPTMLVHNKE